MNVNNRRRLKALVTRKTINFELERRWVQAVIRYPDACNAITKDLVEHAEGRETVHYADWYANKLREYLAEGGEDDLTAFIEWLGKAPVVRDEGLP